MASSTWKTRRWSGRRGELPPLDLTDALSVDLLTEDVPQSAPEAVVTYCFIVDDAQVATQEAREGDAIQRPADPPAPEGYAFIGWFLEDDAPLFADADSDGAIDPVVAHPDPLCPQIVVTARFEAVEESADQPDEAVTEAPAEQPAEDETEAPVEQPAEDDDAFP